MYILKCLINSQMLSSLMIVYEISSALFCDSIHMNYFDTMRNGNSLLWDYFLLLYG